MSFNDLRWSDYIPSTFWLHSDYKTRQKDKKDEKDKNDEKDKKDEKGKKCKKRTRGGQKGKGKRGWSSQSFDLLFYMINDLYRSIELRWLLMSGALFILRWSCCFKCVLWRFYSKTFFLMKTKNFCPCDNSFFSDGTGLRHPWG